MRSRDEQIREALNDWLSIPDREPACTCDNGWIPDGVDGVIPCQEPSCPYYINLWDEGE